MSSNANGSAPNDDTFDDRQVPAPPLSAEFGSLMSHGFKRLVTIGVEAATLPVRATRALVMSETLTPARQAANTAVNTVVDASLSIVGDTMRGNQEMTDLIGSIVTRMLVELRTSELVAELIRTQVGMFLDYLVRHPEVVAPLVETVAANYIQTLKQNPTQLRGLVRGVAHDYMSYLAQNPEELEPLVEAAAGGYMAQLQMRPQSLDGLVRAIGNRYVTYLGENPKMLDELVQNVAGGYISTLEQDPARLDGLVQNVGDRYLDYLNESPETVQELLSGQSQSLATSMLGQVRERSAGGDYALEDAFRRLLGRPPRASPPSTRSTPNTET